MGTPTSKPKAQHSMVHGLRDDSIAGDASDEPVADGEPPRHEDAIRDDTQKRHFEGEDPPAMRTPGSPREGGDPTDPDDHPTND